MPRGSRPGERRGGRKAGTPNQMTAVLRERINKADPIGFLIDVMRGKAIECAVLKEGREKKAKLYPTMDERLSAARQLANKIAPDQKAVEIGGEGGGPVTVQVVRFSDAAE